MERIYCISTIRWYTYPAWQILDFCFAFLYLEYYIFMSFPQRYINMCVHRKLWSIIILNDTAGEKILYDCIITTQFRTQPKTGSYIILQIRSPPAWLFLLHLGWRNIERMTVTTKRSNSDKAQQTGYGRAVAIAKVKVGAPNFLCHLK